MTKLKTKVYANVYDEYWCKISQPNFSKPNPTTHKKDYTLQLSWILSRFSRMVQYIQINVILHISKRQKPHNDLNRCRRIIWYYSTSIHDKKCLLKLVYMFNTYAGSIPGLASGLRIWCFSKLWHKSWMQLRSGIAVV